MIVFNHDTFEATLENVARILAIFVITHTENALEPTHPFAEVWLRSFDRQMEMVPHDDPGMKNPTTPPARLPQGFLKGVLCPIGLKNPAPVVPAIYHMIQPSLALKS
jgi:hypothetical protein